MTGDIDYMQRSLALARQALGASRPNPAVGCVIVSAGQVTGEGFTQPAGQAHAEIMALRQAGASARNATVFVTLEPCAHHGRTGPCAQALIDAGVARVVYALEDPNPLVSGKGLAMLRAAGIAVDGPLCEAEAVALNPGFIKRMRTGMPYVRCKVGMSLDGRTAMASGESKWITGEEARADVQQWRARSCAIMTGIGTVLADDPALNVRVEGYDVPQPLRVVLDSHHRLPAQAQLLHLPGQVLVFSAGPAPAGHDTPAGTQFLSVEHDATGLSLTRILQVLARDWQCNEVLVEAGATLTGALLKAALVDELVTYVAPTLLGHEGRPMAVLDALHTLADRVQLQFLDVAMLGKDCRIRTLPANRP